MNTLKSHLDGLIVVDAKPDDYEEIFSASVRHDVDASHYSTGEDALRATGARPTTLWIVNIQLPDMSGVAFLTLIRRRWRRCNVFLVADAYSSDDERAARAAAATAYFCKPVSTAWLERYQTRCRSPAIRAGPAPFY